MMRDTSRDHSVFFRAYSPKSARYINRIGVASCWDGMPVTADGAAQKFKEYTQQRGTVQGVNLDKCVCVTIVSKLNAKGKPLKRGKVKYVRLPVIY